MRKAIRLIIIFYQRFISPWLPAHCRYSPTCSQYMLEAVQLYGARQGMWLGTKRLCRCNPLGSHGFDPVPVNPILSTSAVTNRNHQQSPERACVEDNPDSCSIGEYKLNG